MGKALALLVLMVSFCAAGSAKTASGLLTVSVTVVPACTVIGDSTQPRLQCTPETPATITVASASPNDLQASQVPPVSIERESVQDAGKSLTVTTITW
jgi:hypothetical protein